MVPYHPELVGSYDWASHGKQTGITHEYTLSASGGSDRFKGYKSEGGSLVRAISVYLEYFFEARPIDIGLSP